MTRDRDIYEAPQSKYAYRDDEPSPEDNTGPAPQSHAPEAAGNRGARPPAEGSGAVIGGGAGAGGGGGAEDYVDDSVGGGGKVDITPLRPRPRTGADGAKHGSD